MTPGICRESPCHRGKWDVQELPSRSRLRRECLKVQRTARVEGGPRAKDPELQAPRRRAAHRAGRGRRAVAMAPAGVTACRDVGYRRGQAASEQVPLGWGHGDSWGGGNPQALPGAPSGSLGWSKIHGSSNPGLGRSGRGRFEGTPSPLRAPGGPLGGGDSSRGCARRGSRCSGHAGF